MSLATTGIDTGRALNRRVEFVVPTPEAKTRVQRLEATLRLAA